MEIARMTEGGQIVLPVSVRRRLNLKGGDKVAIVEEDGRLCLMNAGLAAYKQVVRAFEGEAEKAGFHSEEELMEYMREIRKEVRGY